MRKKGNVSSKTQVSNVDTKNESQTKTKNKEKRVPKGPITFKISLSDEQKEAKSLLLQNDVMVIFGKAGSGKTLISAQAALDALFTRKIENIYITRPTVSKEDIGFLPGDLKDKMDPWLAPIYHNMYTLYDKNAIDKLLAEKKIEIAPMSFMRGITFVDSYVLVDECQNITKEQMNMLITRIGKGSKMIFTGDTAQIDLKRNSDSGLNYLLQLGEGIEGFTTFELKENRRHPIVDKFIDKMSELEQKEKEQNKK